jgi:pimeloyl-ACP methyl ester carboxylesterase
MKPLHCIKVIENEADKSNSFGRGFSDDPADIPQDVRLFSSQILLVLASSPLSWTGAQSGGFSLIGYSLGGGISVGFTSHFPSLVNSLVLIAPAGLIRMHNISRGNRLIYSEGVIPEFILSAAVKRRLKTPLYPTKVPKLDESKTGAAEAAAAELPPTESSPKVPLSRSRPNITIEKCAVFQVDHHKGFVPAFISSIRFGPITGQHKYWKRIGQRLTQQKGKAWNEEFTDGLEKGKVLIVTGNNDPIIKKKELIEDATSVFEGNVVFRFIEAGHEAPVLKGDEVVRHILQFWNTE